MGYSRNNVLKIRWNYPELWKVGHLFILFRWAR